MPTSPERVCSHVGWAGLFGVAGAGGVVVLALAAVLVAVPWAVLIGAAAALVLGLVLWRSGPGMVLWGLGARPVAEGELPRVVEAAKWLSASVGVDPPRVMVQDCDGVFAATVALSPGGLQRSKDGLVTPSGVLVVGVATEELLSPLQVEALVARELVRMTLCTPWARAWDLLSTSALWAATKAVPPAVVARERQLELLADARALFVTRYPPALQGVLERTAEAPPPLPTGRQRLVAGFWMPRAGEAEGILRSRIEALSEWL